VAAGAVVLVAAVGGGCAGGIDLRDENGAGISEDGGGDISVGAGPTESEVSGDGTPGSSAGGALGTDQLINVAKTGAPAPQGCGDLGRRGRRHLGGGPHLRDRGLR